MLVAVSTQIDENLTYYSAVGNFQGWLFTKVFSMKFRDILWCGTSKQSAKVFSTKIVFFHQFTKVFSPESCHYTVW